MLSNCRSCNSDSLTLTAKRKSFPLYIWPLQSTETTKFKDIELFVCNHCGYMQLQNLDSKTISEIYRDEAFNIDNVAQNQIRYELISGGELNKFANKKVLEIGGGRNSFVQSLPKNTEKWVADFTIDKSVDSMLSGSFIGDFNSIEITEKGFDFICMFHVLEHFNNPSMALKKIKGLLKKNGSLFIEVPNFGYECKELPFYTLFHMHISLFSEISLKTMMSRHGFNCVRFHKKNDVLLAEFNVGSKKKTENHKNHSMDLINLLDSNIEKIDKKLKEITKTFEDEKVAIFGAGGSTTLFLYNFPFLIEKISCAIDNNEKKWGRFICDGKIPVFSYKEFTNQDINKVILLDENHIKYINEKNINIINIGNLNGK